MYLENLSKFFKENGLFLMQITAIVLPFVFFTVYFSNVETDDTFDVSSISKVEMNAATGNAQKVDAPKDDKKEENQSAGSSSTFEVDEVSQEMLNKSAGNPKEMLSGNSPCTSFEDVRTVAKYTGTISKAKNIERFKRPLPAMITETEYACVDASGAKKTKATTMGVAVDSDTNTLRCIQSNSDETMDSEARFKHVLKMMTHHCGFKLSEHHAISTGKQP